MITCAAMAIGLTGTSARADVIAITAAAFPAGSSLIDKDLPGLDQA